jgi:sugar/nucleoside kinase (ribokinase family)
MAKKKGLMTSVDIVSEQSNRYIEIIPPALPYVDLLFLNEFETEMLTGVSILDEEGNLKMENGFHATELLLNLGILQWVIIHFSSGAIAMSKQGEKIYQKGICVPMESIKGTVGAGDAFAAGVLAGIHENWSMEECLVSGVSVAASSLQDVTSTGSIRPWRYCMKLGTELGWRS